MHKDDGVFMIIWSKGKMHAVRIRANAKDKMPFCTCVDWQHAMAHSYHVSTCLLCSIPKVDGHITDFKF